MSESSYTPGPWTVLTTGSSIVVVSDQEPVAMIGHNRANARLIHAAPDMLEALIAAEGNSIDDDPAVWKQIADAITKARGTE